VIDKEPRVATIREYIPGYDERLKGLNKPLAIVNETKGCDDNVQINCSKIEKFNHELDKKLAVYKVASETYFFRKQVAIEKLN
jgi:hypothetical protein